VTRRVVVAVATICVLASACRGDRPLAVVTPKPTAPPTVSTTSAPRDFGLQELSGENKGSALCGEYSLVWQSPDVGQGGTPASLTAISGGDVVLDIEGRDEHEQLLALWCGDVTGDGRLELGTERYTGGAHCCFVMRVDTLDGPTLLDEDLGNYGDPKPKQLDGSGPQELVGRSDVLAYFADLPFAVDYGLPLVFAFRNGHFVDATTDFKAHLREQRDETQQDLEKAIANDADEAAVKGGALALFGHYVLLGQEQSGLDDVAAAVPAEVGDWLREHAEEAVALIKGEK
jgi:hypothetical protein